LKGNRLGGALNMDIGEEAMDMLHAYALTIEETE
jgi:hypothetical protein